MSLICELILFGKICALSLIAGCPEMTETLYLKIVYISYFKLSLVELN